MPCHPHRTAHVERAACGRYAIARGGSFVAVELQALAVRITIRQRSRQTARVRKW